jgi:hypothetical protein
MTSLIVHTCIFWLIYFSFTSFAMASWNRNAKSTFRHYVALNRSDRFLYITYFTSAINAIVCLVYFVLGFLACEPPKQHSRDIFLGNTYLRNDWCVDNPSLTDTLAVQAFLGYIVWDIFVVLFLIGDVRSGSAKQTIMHHMIVILGSVGNLITGRYFTVLSTGSMLNELSTPFTNMRWFLSTHKMGDSALYFWNGWIFMFSFVLSRNVYQTILVLWMLMPAVKRDNYGHDDILIVKLTMWFLLSLYTLLCLLNFYWASKIIRGALKVL